MVLVAWIVASCASSGTKYHDVNMDFGAVKTVAVLPFANLSRDNVAGERVRDVFTNMLLATGAMYVMPNGEVARGLNRIGVQNPTAPSAEEVSKLGGLLKCDAIIGGVVKEYGEVRSGTSTANIVSASIQMYEVASGKIVWSASSTKGGVSMANRLFGSGGSPANDVTESLVNDLLDRLFKQ
jgi:hypothetical protein